MCLGERSCSVGIFAALLYPVGRVQEYQVTALGLFGKANGYIMVDDIISGRLKVVGQTSPPKVAACIQGGTASAKRIDDQIIRTSEIIERV